MNTVPKIPAPYSPVEYTISVPTLTTNIFEYVEDIHYRLMLQNAFQSISETNTWGFVKKDHHAFMFCSEPEIYKIINKMAELGYEGHSGCSFACTMRTMQYLIQNGEEKFKELFLKK
jgi:hypothetical protein